MLYVSQEVTSPCRVLPFLKLILLFTLLFLSKQTRHGKNIVSLHFFLFIRGHAKYLSREQCLATLCSSCSLQKYLERKPAALYEAGRRVLMVMKVSKIWRTELNTVHLYQHYSLFMHNKLQHILREDCCECVQPAQISVLT